MSIDFTQYTIHGVNQIQIVNPSTHQKDFNGAHDVHSSSEAVTQVKEYTHSSTKLWSQCTRYHKVGPSFLHHSIRGHGTQRY